MLEQELAARLAAFAPLAALIADRVYPVRAPAKTAAPFAVWTRADTNPNDTLAGDGASVAEFEVDVYAPTYAGAKLAAEQVIAALHAWQSEQPAALMSAALANAFDDYDPETALYRAGLAFNLLYRT